MNQFARLFCLFALPAFLVSVKVSAESEETAPRLAECSVGGPFGTSWYGEVLLGQSLKIQSGTKAVEIIDRFEDSGEEFLVVHVDLHWVNPRFVPKNIVLTTSTSAAIALDAVTLFDRTSDTMVHCKIKK